MNALPPDRERWALLRQLTHDETYSGTTFAHAARTVGFCGNWRDEQTEVLRKLNDALRAVLREPVRV